jgi:translation elongation factor P/translation initiation factor 5A
MFVYGACRSSRFEIRYQAEDIYYFMDTGNCEQLPVPARNIQDSIKYIKQDSNVVLDAWKDMPCWLLLPKQVSLTVAKVSACDAGDGSYLG